MTHGGRVQVQQTNKHLADDPRTDRTKSIPAAPDVSFA